MDDIDRAQAQEQMQRDAAIAAARAGTALATGHCHHCGRRLGALQRFCDSDCRDDYERIAAARRRNGRGA